ncbi:hypothetical protein CIW48_06170 [Methylobacterium sp. P1-11]|nr:hypothetical protein CIW48_06170 [Methylobacterium sp. P1-11]
MPERRWQGCGGAFEDAGRWRQRCIQVLLGPKRHSPIHTAAELIIETRDDVAGVVLRDRTTFDQRDA